MTTKPTHTPGPWKYEDGFSMLTSGGHLLNMDQRTNEGKANAHLIAAAPELLDACKILVAWAKGNNLIGNSTEPPGIDEAMRAITKAEGATTKQQTHTRQSDEMENRVDLLDPLAGSPIRENPEWQGD